jgi:glycosyltransferase involved in cell wall biosynthesis
MACSVPVVAFECTGIQEVVGHKSTGYLAKAYDDNDLANGIVWCLENNKNRTLSINARNKVLSNYTIDIVAKQYKELYESLV